MLRNLTKAYAFVFSSKVIVLLISVLSTPVIVRVLGKEQYGDFATVLSIVGLTMIATNAGIFDGIRKHTAEVHECDDWEDEIFAFYWRVAITLAGLVALGFVVVRGYTTSLLGAQFPELFLLAAGMIVGRQMFSLSRGALMGLGSESLSEPLFIIRKLVFVILGVSLAILGLGVKGMLVGRIVAVLIVTVLALWFLSRKIDVIRGISMLGARSPLPWRRLLTFNIWNTGFLLLVQSLYHVDILLLQFFRGSGPTGVYKAALVIAEFLWFASTASRLVLLQSIAKLWSQKEYDQISYISSMVVRYTLLLSVLLAIGIVSLAEPFVQFYYGAEYIGAVQPLIILLPGTIGFALAQPVFSISQGKGEMQILVAVTALAATTNAGLNVVLIQAYGLVGAAAATSISYGSMFFLHVLAARRLGFNPLVDLRLLRIIGTGLGTAVVLYAVSRAISSSVVSLLVVPPVGAVVYVALAIKIGAVDVSEVRNALS